MARLWYLGLGKVQHVYKSDGCGDGDGDKRKWRWRFWRTVYGGMESINGGQ